MECYLNAGYAYKKNLALLPPQEVPKDEMKHKAVYLIHDGIPYGYSSVLSNKDNFGFRFHQ